MNIKVFASHLNCPIAQQVRVCLFVMLNFKYTILTAFILLFIAGACFGVTITAKHYRAEIAQMQTEAIKAEHEATVKQLNIEHEWQARQEQLIKRLQMRSTRLKTSIMLLCLSCMLTACTQTVAVPVKQHCPQIPPLPEKLKQPVNVDSLDTTEELLQSMHLSSQLSVMRLQLNVMS